MGGIAQAFGSNRPITATASVSGAGLTTTRDLYVEKTVPIQVTDTEIIYSASDEKETTFVVGDFTGSCKLEGSSGYHESYTLQNGIMQSKALIAGGGSETRTKIKDATKGSPVLGVYATNQDSSIFGVYVGNPNNFCLFDVKVTATPTFTFSANAALIQLKCHFEPGLC